MFVAALRRLHHLAQRVLPERRLYVRRSGDWWVATVSTRAQLVVGASAAAVLICATAGSVGLGAAPQGGRHAQPVSAQQASLNPAVRGPSSQEAPLSRMAAVLERRRQALAVLVQRLEGAGLGQASTPGAAPPSTGSLAQLQAVRDSQDTLVMRAEAFAKIRAARLRTALHIAGVDPRAAVRRSPDSALGMGGPLIAADDPRALAALLGVDAPFAGRVMHAARDLGDADKLSSAAAELPLGPPVADPVRSSGFGLRSDPFTGAAAFHAGQDFAGALRQPVSATGPGVVSFTGQRSGYGNTVEIDHGRGFKTRYAHLAAFAVRAGQKVAAGERVGLMGSTGRSTGVHLHYEVWVNDRVQNPDRYLRAGEYVHAAG